MQRQLDYTWATVPSKEGRYQRDLHTISYWGVDTEDSHQTYTSIAHPLYMSSPGGTFTQKGPYRILFRRLQLSVHVAFSQAQPNCSELPYWGFYRFTLIKREKKNPPTVNTAIWVYTNALGPGVDIDQPALDLPWIELGADEYLSFSIDIYREPLTVPTGWRSRWLSAAWIDTYTQH